MYFKNSQILSILSCIIVLKLIIINNNNVSARIPQSERFKIYKEAMELRYGISETDDSLEYYKSYCYDAIPLLEKVADGYDDRIASSSLCELGMIYFLGYKRYFTYHYDIAKAKQYFIKSSQMGYPRSQFMLSLLYSYKFENGPSVDHEKAKLLLERSSNSKYFPAMLAKAYQCLNDKESPDPYKAIKIYKKLIYNRNYFKTDSIVLLEQITLSDSSRNGFRDSSNPTRLVREGSQFYYYPDDFVPDALYIELKEVVCRKSKYPYESTEYVEEVLSKMRKGRSHKDMSLIILGLGSMYMVGEWVPKNTEIGVQLLDKAVSLGNNTAAYLLGCHYYFKVYSLKNYKSIVQNLNLALKYLRLVAHFFEGETLYYIAQILDQLTNMEGQSVNESELQNIYKLYRMSADYGYLHSYLRCAEMLEEGLGVDKDINEAALNYKIAAEQTLIYFLQWDNFHQMVKENPQGATIMSLMAAYCGLVSGNWNVGMILENKKSRVFDKSLVKQNFNEALLQGELFAIIRLANIANNEGKTLLARELYQRGFEAGDIECTDPLIKMYSKDNINKAINLIEYKEYRSRFNNHKEYESLVKNYLDSFVNQGTLAYLRMKQKFNNMLK